jgi:probable HAF family extracellular repeat protein
MHPLRFRRVPTAVLVSVILLVPASRVAADPLYSVTDLGAVSQSDASVGTLVGKSINIDQAGNVSYSPGGGWSSATSTALVPDGDRPMWQVVKPSDNGQYVVGTAERAQEPFFWDAFLATGGKATAIGPVFPSDHEQFSGAYAVNNSGQAVGVTSDLTANSSSGFLSTPGRGTVLIPGLGAAFGINNLGQVVGASQVQGASTWHAFLSNNGQAAVDLNTLIPDSSRWTLTSATGINDKGQIVGYGVDASGNSHAVLLTPDGTGNPTPAAPVPEPSPLAFFGLAMAFLTGQRAIAGIHRRRAGVD